MAGVHAVDLSTICTSGDVKTLPLWDVLGIGGEEKEHVQKDDDDDEEEEEEEESKVSKRRRLCTPLFQRRYVWGAKEWARMLRDATAGNVIKLGRIVVVRSKMRSESEVLSVIDGQQRLTTSTLLIAAVRSALILLKEKRIPGSIRRATMFYDGAPVFQPTYFDRFSYFRAIGVERKFWEMLPDDDNAKASQIAKCHDFFTKKLAAKFRAVEPHERFGAAATFVDSILRRFHILRFVARNDGDMTTMYERLAVREAGIIDAFCASGAGVGMLSIDLTRNLFMSYFEKGGEENDHGASAMASQHEAYNDLWVPLEAEVEARSKTHGIPRWKLFEMFFSAFAKCDTIKEKRKSSSNDRSRARTTALTASYQVVKAFVKTKMKAQGAVWPKNASLCASIATKLLKDARLFLREWEPGVDETAEAKDGVSDLPSMMKKGSMPKVNIMVGKNTGKYNSTVLPGLQR